MASLLDEALSYARRGWRVLPLHNLAGTSLCSCGRNECRIGGQHEKSVAKHPRTGNWQNEATSDQLTVIAWWRQWPSANIGVATGSGSGFIVLDVDVHRGAPGYESLDILETFLGKLPRTLTAATGSGGQHRLFRYPAGLSICNSAGWRGAAGIDWRADGGQIVVAPSRALAGQYHWTSLVEIAELPPTWIDAHRDYEAKRGAKRLKIAPTKKRTPSAVEAAEDEDVVDSLHQAGNSEKFLKLWSGDWSSLGYESQSNADLALCSIISFWCDPDAPAPSADRIDRIFRQSELYRDKWERNDYRDKTVAMAVEQEALRRAADASFREHVFGSIPAEAQASHDDLVAQERARLLGGSIGVAPPPPPPAPSRPAGVNTGEVLVQIRQLVRKNKNSQAPIAKIDGDMTENFMAGEQLISAAEIARTPNLTAFTGNTGLKRVAQLLGKNLEANIPWEAIVNGRPAILRVPQSTESIAYMGKVFAEAQASQLRKKIQQHQKDQEENKKREQELAEREARSLENFNNLLRQRR